jgi:hypothetical protein
VFKVVVQSIMYEVTSIMYHVPSTEDKVLSIKLLCFMGQVEGKWYDVLKSID